MTKPAPQKGIPSKQTQIAEHYSRPRKSVKNKNELNKTKEERARKIPSIAKTAVLMILVCGQRLAAGHCNGKTKQNFSPPNFPFRASPNPPTTLTFLPLFLLLNKQSPATETCSSHHSFYKITLPATSHSNNG